MSIINIKVLISHHLVRVVSQLRESCLYFPRTCTLTCCTYITFVHRYRDCNMHLIGSYCLAKKHFCYGCNKLQFLKDGVLRYSLTRWWFLISFSRGLEKYISVEIIALFFFSFLCFHLDSHYEKCRFVYDLTNVHSSITNITDRAVSAEID